MSFWHVVNCLDMCFRSCCLAGRAYPLGDIPSDLVPRVKHEVGQGHVQCQGNWDNLSQIFLKIWEKVNMFAGSSDRNTSKNIYLSIDSQTLFLL